jgi:hypothetical protein
LKLDRPLSLHDLRFLSFFSSLLIVLISPGEARLAGVGRMLMGGFLLKQSLFFQSYDIVS